MNPGSTVTTEQILSALAIDLADGSINGLQDSYQIPALRDVDDIGSIIVVDPTTLVVPGTTITLDNIEGMLVAEAENICDGCDLDLVSNYLQNGSIDVIPTPVSLDVTPLVKSSLTEIASVSNTIFELTFSSTLDVEVLRILIITRLPIVKEMHWLSCLPD